MDEQHLIAQIRQATTKANRNNVTRTQAYLAFYLELKRFTGRYWPIWSHEMAVEHDRLKRRMATAYHGCTGNRAVFCFWKDVTG
ncbi:DUF2515 family protein [Brevibacillus brevis]